MVVALTRHTDGPWKVVDDTDIVGDCNGEECLVAADVLLPADAILIAAAPRMLKALLRAETAVDDPHQYLVGGSNDRERVIEEIRAAIAAATAPCPKP